MTELLDKVYWFLLFLALCVPLKAILVALVILIGMWTLVVKTLRA